MKNNKDVLDLNSVPLISKGIVFRKDDNGMLIFQINTDEMYFVSHEIFPLIELCNGANTCQDILEILKGNDSQTTDIDKSYSMFIENLLHRDLISLI